MVLIITCTLEPAGITTLPFLSFTLAATVPVMFWPALWVRELIPSSNLAEMAVPEASIRSRAAALATGFAAGLAGVRLDVLDARSFIGELASTAGRCRSRVESSPAAPASG